MAAPSFPNDRDGDWLAGRTRVPLRPPLTHLLLQPGDPGNVQALLSQIERLEQEKVELQLLLDAEIPPVAGHVLFLETAAGYDVVESGELPPPVDQLLFVHGRAYSIEGERRSPFPQDARPCFICRPS